MVSPSLQRLWLPSTPAEGQGYHLPPTCQGEAPSKAKCWGRNWQPGAWSAPGPAPTHFQGMAVQPTPLEACPRTSSTCDRWAYVHKLTPVSSISPTGPAAPGRPRPSVACTALLRRSRPSSRSPGAPVRPQLSLCRPQGPTCQAHTSPLDVGLLQTTCLKVAPPPQLYPWLLPCPVLWPSLCATSYQDLISGSQKLSEPVSTMSREGSHAPSPVQCGPTPPSWGVPRGPLASSKTCGWTSNPQC